MDLKSIMDDVISQFLEKGNQPFWEEGDDRDIALVFENVTGKDTVIKSSATLFSFLMAGMVETGNYFKRMGAVSMRLWKPLLQSVSSKLYEKLKADYEKESEEIRQKYPAPTSGVIKEAEDKMKMLLDLIPIREVVSDVDDIEYVRTMAKGYVDEILRMFGKLDTSDTPYATGSELIEAYRDIVAGSFDILTTKIS